MTAVQQFWPMATMFASKAGLKLPFVLPQLSHIAQDMGPSCQYSWFDARGLRSHYRGAGIEPTLGAVAGGAIGAGIMMPALARRRQIDPRTQSAIHLSGIGKASLIYANDYNDEFPPNLNELIEKAAIDPRMLESPLKPKNFVGPSYIYIAGQNISMDPRNIVAYENPGFCSDRLNVLYLDCHVGLTKRDEFLRQLEATYKRLGREMPEIKFKGSQ
jgi:prepilin-type processing-associated H-X9-DG protein